MYFSFTTQLPRIPTDTCLGGILADEMGLGKTLEIVSLILLRPCPEAPSRPLFDLEHETDLPGEFAFRVLAAGDAEDEVDHRPPSPALSDKTMPMVEENVFCVCGCGQLSPDTTISCTRCDTPWLQHRECVQFKPAVEMTGGRVARMRYICPQCWNNVSLFCLCYSSKLRAGVKGSARYDREAD